MTRNPYRFSRVIHDRRGEPPTNSPESIVNNSAAPNLTAVNNLLPSGIRAGETRRPDDE